MKMQLYFMQTRSGLHCGVGQGLSDIDLPVAKHSLTGHPLVPGTSIKGVLRDYFEETEEQEKFAAAFGGMQKGKSDFASALSFTDCQLICLPVRSYFGTYAHAASPQTLRLLKEEMTRGGYENLPEIPRFAHPQDTTEYHSAVPKDSRLRRAGGKQLLLEELDLLVDTEFQKNADEWAALLAEELCPNDAEGQSFFHEGFVVVDNDVLNFLCETSLPVSAHNKIGENGVVEDGALWYEEYVPAETLFLGAVYGENGRGEKHHNLSAGALLDLVCSTPLSLQVGGNATTGRGLVSMIFSQRRAE
ncbi:type III-B CRISPR module RAMP protein Cmr4 [Desulforhopalus vacuolatus]|uniref:type III-B CRISPR module RAMP protein Cmr4 n=1 Tax=Desulforhopalus vacuolatus TaxID=40414 RepID=UPI00196499E9|nr:type III-B CRISPR module RAMP protein Cmr4 [Desulforhopalus vacuolatus]MBM9520416.1 type III-B CRISPR module RAMP protein Cmr4 [Desulforhopalus vacuolatus]